MAERKLAAFKYDHAGKSPRTLKQLLLGGALLTAAWPAFVLPPLGVVLLLVGLIALFARPARRLRLGPRYLVCGPTVVYFANVKEAELNAIAGTLRLQTVSGATALIERQKFPTNARKAEKIARNKAAKFDKVSTRIIERVRRASPDAIISAPSASA